LPPHGPRRVLPDLTESRQIGGRGLAAGRGVASRLYDAVEAAARARGIQRPYTEASEPARRLFERKGFTVLERRDMMLRGVPIHNYRMAKTLG
jgi:putative acetyltransferase